MKVYTESTSYFLKLYTDTYKPITQPEELALIKEAQSDRKKFNSFWSRNLALCAHAANDFCMHTYVDVELDDVVQEATFGLRRAIELYDEKCQTRFSTYAYIWIKQAMFRYVEYFGDTIRKPVAFQTKCRAYHKADKKYEYIEDPAERRSKIRRELIKSEIVKSDVDFSFLEYWMNNRTYASLDKFVCTDEGEGDITLGDMIMDANVRYQSELEERELAKHINSLLTESLNDRAKYVIEERFGFNGEPRTLESIADELGVCRERVRQIQKKALEHLQEKFDIDEFGVDIDGYTLYDYLY